MCSNVTFAKYDVSLISHMDRRIGHIHQDRYTMVKDDNFSY